MVVPFLRAEDREERTNLQRKADAFCSQVSEVPMRQPSQDARSQLGLPVWSSGGRAGYPIPIDADRYVVHLLIPWWLRR